MHTESKAVIVLQGVTNVAESAGVWTVTIADQTLTFDRADWTIITNSIAAPIPAEEP